MPNDHLQRPARDFAGKIQQLLNSTICSNVRINTVVSRPGTALIGHRLTRRRLLSEPIPVRRDGRAKPHCWLDLSYTLCLDDHPNYLAVQTSFFAVLAPDGDRTPLCHFDYERDKPDGYPEAHVQVYGRSLALERWRLADGRGLEKLHFPTGGRRFRPTLEDVVDFLAAERLVPPLTDAGRHAVEAGREEFRRIQLRAAIRRDMETARQAVSDFGARS